jgi:hypothetical protein
MDRNRFQDEAELLEQAMAAFHETTGLRLELERRTADQGVHAALRLEHQDPNDGFVTEVRPRINNALVGIVRNHFDNLAQPGCLVTTYVNPQMAERLRNLAIAFIDTVGNVYLNAPPVYVYVKGNRPPKERGAAKQTRAFQATGLKVVFALLARPALAAEPYREIAQVTGVALGTIAWVIRDLTRLDFVVTVEGGQRRLRNREELLHRWVAAYPEQLRPKLIVGRFRAPKPDWWRTATLDRREAYWGGEIAGAHLTRHLHPELVTVYCRGAMHEFQLKNRLRKDPEGETELVRVFWDRALDYNKDGLVPPILTYADLMGTGDPRNIETARLLYEQEIE